jgi:hypothetical protein
VRASHGEAPCGGALAVREEDGVEWFTPAARGEANRLKHYARTGRSYLQGGAGEDEARTANFAGVGARRRSRVERERDGGGTALKRDEERFPGVASGYANLATQMVSWPRAQTRREGAAAVGKQLGGEQSVARLL